MAITTKSSLPTCEKCDDFGCYTRQKYLNQKGCFFNMKIDRLETHDRFQHFTKQQFDIGECCNEVIKNRPAEFGNRPFYIFAHTRTDDDGVTQRLIWQPRLTRPKPQTNSMLFKAYPPTDVLRVIWIIPKRELWSNYGKGQLCENKTISDSIYDFQHNRARLAHPDAEDVDDETAKSIYDEIARNARNRTNSKQKEESNGL